MMKSIVCLALASLFVGSGHRVYLDQGDLIPAAVEWSLLIAGSLALLVMPSRLRGASLGSPAIWSLALIATAAALIDRRPTMILSAAACCMSLLSLVVGRRGVAERFLQVTSGLAIIWIVRLALDLAALWRISMSWVVEAIATFFELFGAQIGFQADGLVIETVRGHQVVLASSVLFGLSVLGPLWALLVVRAWGGSDLRNATKHLVRGTVSCAAGVLVRVAAFLVVTEYLDGQMEYSSRDFAIAPLNDWRFTLALDACAIVAAASVYALFGRHFGLKVRGSSDGASNQARRRRIATLACALLASVGLGFERVADTLGRPSGGSVVIDEGHSEWEPTDLQLDRDVYGAESGYNFRSLVDWLEEGYGPIRRNYETIDESLLGTVGTLIIKTPTTHFSTEEIDEILQHVDDGGGLILIGDHTNVFGTGAVLNEFGARLGFRYDYDSVFDQRQRFEQVYRREVQLARHPILSHVPKIRFEVGCSIDLESADWTPVIVGRGLKNLPIDYKASNFYPAAKDASYMRFGQMAEVATRSYGNGRIAILSDSTLLSSFSVMLPGRRELVEAMVDWVGRSEVGERTRRGVRFVGIAAALMALLLVRGAGEAVPGLVLAAGVSASVALGGFFEIRRVPTQEISAVTTHRAVHFYTGSDTAFWPVDQFVRDHDISFGLFFQWPLRVGVFPRLEASLDTALSEANALVLIDPPASDEDRVEDLLEFASGGGVVVALQSQSNKLVRNLSVSLGLANPTTWLPDGHGEFESQTLVTPNGQVPLGDFLGGLYGLSGGSSLATAIDSATSAHRSVLTRVAVGQGHVIVGTLGALFTDRGYGSKYSAVPSPARRKLFEVEYDLFAAILQHQSQFTLAGDIR